MTGWQRDQDRGGTGHWVEPPDLGPGTGPGEFRLSDVRLGTFGGSQGGLRPVGPISPNRIGYDLTPVVQHGRPRGADLPDRPQPSARASELEARQGAHGPGTASGMLPVPAPGTGSVPGMSPVDRGPRPSPHARDRMPQPDACPPEWTPPEAVPVGGSPGQCDWLPPEPGSPDRTAHGESGAWDRTPPVVSSRNWTPEGEPGWTPQGETGSRDGLAHGEAGSPEREPWDAGSRDRIAPETGSQNRTPPADPGSRDRTPPDAGPRERTSWDGGSPDWTAHRETGSRDGFLPGESAPRESAPAETGAWDWTPLREPGPRDWTPAPGPRDWTPADAGQPDRLAAPGSADPASPLIPSPTPPPGTPPGSEQGAAARRYVPDEPSAAELVRPYFRTKGRTRPKLALSVEALVSTSDKGMNATDLAVPEHRSICDLCQDTRSVAEVAAFLRLPLGVARVLIGDVATLGLVLIHTTSSHMVGDRPSIDFMERVLSGLRTV